MRRRFSHTITVPLSADRAIHLFTPRGEEDWVPGWAPHYLHPAGGETEADMVFTTGEGDEATIWTCLVWSPETGHARYLRVTPASRLAFVDVRCRPDAAQTRVTVSYEMQALTDAGKALIAATTEASFVRMIGEWEGLIRAMQSG